MFRTLSLLIDVTSATRIFQPLDAADDRPNFVLLLCDDIGAHELGMYGHPKYKTPKRQKRGGEEAKP